MTRPRHAAAGRRAALAGSSCLARVAAHALIGLGAAMALGAAAQAQTLPTGGSVAVGGATITTGPGAMTINQSTQNAAINWQSFSIGQGGSVVFVQPNSQSAALNRVTGPDGSSIMGSLTSNGQVFLINPNGVLFGQGPRSMSADWSRPLWA